MTVEVYHDFEQLGKIQQEWDSFVESVAGDIFLTYDWCQLWWKYYAKNRNLRVFIFRNNNELVGIIPLFLEKLWLGPVFVRAVKIVGSDFAIAQFSLPISNEHMEQVIERLFELLSEDAWDIAHIGPIAGLYKYYDELKDAFLKYFGSSHSVVTKVKGVQTYFQLADSWDAQLSKLSKRDRGDIRRNFRYLRKTIDNESASVESRFITDQELAVAFDEFIGIHQSHWNKLRKAGHFVDWPESKDFHYEMAKAQLKYGRLRLLKVSIKDYCLGYEYNYKFGDKYFQLLNGRSDSAEMRHISVGKITFSELVKKVLHEENRCIDSMRGRYEHKLRLGGELFPINSIYIIPKRLSTVVRATIFLALARLLNLFYYKIWFSRIAPRVPNKPRALWKMWIRICAFA